MDTCCLGHRVFYCGVVPPYFGAVKTSMNESTQSCPWETRHRPVNCGMYAKSRKLPYEVFAKVSPLRNTNGSGVGMAEKSAW